MLTYVYEQLMEISFYSLKALGFRQSECPGKGKNILKIPIEKVILYERRKFAYYKTVYVLPHNSHCIYNVIHIMLHRHDIRS